MDFRGMTVDRLRQLLEGVDGDMPVYIQTDYYATQPDWHDAGAIDNFKNGKPAFVIEA